MNGEEGRPQFGDTLDPACDRVADVVQLEIDKDLLALVGELPHQRQAAGEAELIADLVERDGIAKPRHHRLRLLEAGHVERHNQPVAGRNDRWLHGHLTSFAGTSRSVA
jgi:hypothetical protein